MSLLLSREDGGTTLHLVENGFQTELYHTQNTGRLDEELAELVRGQQGGVVGARVLPTEAMNLAQGLDVRTWLERGLVDFLVPHI